MSQLPVPKAVIPESNRFRDELRQLCHQEGLKEIQRRIHLHDERPLGVQAWVGLVKITGAVTDESTIRKRMNELADERWWVIRPWVHLPVKFKDRLSSATYQSIETLQSAYLPSPAFLPKMEAYCERATKMGIVKFLEWVSLEKVTG